MPRKLNFAQGEITATADRAHTPSARAVGGATDHKSELHKFSQLVLKKLADDSIDPTPENYNIYFNKLLDDRPAEFQNSVSQLLSSTKLAAVTQQQASLEKEIKHGFNDIKNMLQVVALVFKNVSIMKGIVEKRLEEVSANSNPIELHSIIKAFGGELTRLNSLMQRHLDMIHASYQDVDKVFKSIEESSIYDSKFDIYNKKYFLNSLQTELANVKKFKYNTSVVLIRVKDSVLSVVPSLKDQNGVLRNISKILQKVVKKSDIAAFYGDATFAIILHHTNKDDAQKACQKALDKIYSTTFFILEREIEMDLEAAVTTLRATSSVEETLSNLLDALPNTSKQTKLLEAV